MDKFIKNQTLRSILSAIKPWVVAILFVLILRYTGVLSGLSVMTQTAMMHTGLMDVNTETSSPETATDFNYDFKLKDLNGKIIDVADLKGKVIFLNMWATWCGPCRAEMSSIQQLYNAVKKDDVVFIMLSLDRDGNEQKVKKYVENKGFTFPVYLAADGLPDQLKVPSIPTTFLITKDGKVRTKKVGTANYDTPKFRNLINELAGE